MFLGCRNGDDADAQTLTPVTHRIEEIGRRAIRSRTDLRGSFPVDGPIGSRCPRRVRVSGPRRDQAEAQRNTPNRRAHEAVGSASFRSPAQSRVAPRATGACRTGPVARPVAPSDCRTARRAAGMQGLDSRLSAAGHGMSRVGPPVANSSQQSFPEQDSKPLRAAVRSPWRRPRA